MSTEESISNQSTASSDFTPRPMGTGGARPKTPTRTTRRGRGRGSGGRGGGRHRDIAAEDKRRLKELFDERVANAEEVLNTIEPSETRAKALLRLTLEHQPGLMFDMLALLEPPPTSGPGPSALRWCVCGNCRDMPSDIEKVCCRQPPQRCISNMAYMTYYVLERGTLRMARTFWNDILALTDNPEPGEEMRQFRHAAYRQYVLWNYGRLGVGNRVVIPSCCVWKIRDTFPDPRGYYTGFKVTRLP